MTAGGTWRAPGAARAWSALDTALLAVVTAVAGVLRAVDLGRPARMVFDESYYARDACWYLHHSPDLCRQTLEVSREHPPLGKWLIAGGIELFGYDPAGWRAAGLAAGTLTVALLYVLARRLLGSTLAAALAAGLLAVDFLHFVHSRVAMLDVFVTLFGVAAVLFAVLDRDRMLRGAAERWPWRWRLAAGVSGGAAVASKWSGVFVLAAVIVLVAVWEVARRDGAGRVGAAVRDEWASIAVCLVAVPLVVYVASFAGALNGTVAAAPWQYDSWPRALARRHVHMLTFHADLDVPFPLTSPPWSWPLLKRPVVYDFRADGATYREILALGSPLVWWSSLAATAYMAVRWLRRRDPFAPAAVIVALVVATYAPWLVLGISRSFVFLFYMLPVVPFLVLAVAAVGAELARRMAGRALVVGYAAAAVALFGFYLPLLTARPIGYDDWRQRILFTDCATPRGSATERVDGRLRPRVAPGPPPDGWCWV